MTKTLEQKRAEYAFNIINEIKNESYASDFSILVAKIPSYILTNGLGNTIVFLFSKGKNYHLIIAGLMADWILRVNKINKSEMIEKLENKWIFAPNEVNKYFDEIVKGLILNMNISVYILITNELLALFVWLKRLCEGMIDKKGE